MCRRNIANCLFLAAWEAIPTTGKDPVSLPLEWFSDAPRQESPAVWAPPGCASDALPPVQQRKPAHNSYSGRKHSSLPRLPRQQGHYLPAHPSLLGSPSCHPPALAAPSGMERAVGKAPQERDIPSEGAAAVLMALLLPDERRGVFRSNKSTDVKAISAFSLILHINRNVLKCFFCTV